MIVQPPTIGERFVMRLEPFIECARLAQDAHTQRIIADAAANGRHFLAYSTEKRRDRDGWNCLVTYVVEDQGRNPVDIFTIDGTIAGLAVRGEFAEGFEYWYLPDDELDADLGPAPIAVDRTVFPTDLP